MYKATKGGKESGDSQILLGGVVWVRLVCSVGVSALLCVLLNGVALEGTIQVNRAYQNTWLLGCASAFLTLLLSFRRVL